MQVRSRSMESTFTAGMMHAGPIQQSQARTYLMRTHRVLIPLGVNSQSMSTLLGVSSNLKHSEHCGRVEAEVASGKLQLKHGKACLPERACLRCQRGWRNYSSSGMTGLEILLDVMQAQVASGRLQLRDGGARLREGVAEAAARLADTLSSLAQHSAADPPWPLSCFQAASLRFIDADGQIQVCTCLKQPALHGRDSALWQRQDRQRLPGNEGCTPRLESPYETALVVAALREAMQVTEICCCRGQSQ